MKKVLMPIYSSWTLRNMVRLGVVDSLVKQGADVIITVPTPMLDAIKKEYSKKHVTVVGVNIMNTYNSRLLWLRYFSSVAPDFVYPEINNVTFKIKQDKYKLRKPWTFRLGCVLKWILKIPGMFSLIKAIDWTFFTKKDVIAIVDEHKPDILFSPSILSIDEFYFVEYCQKKKIPVVSMVMSWDNMTSKGRMPYIPEKLIVWNNTMAEEVRDVHNYPISKTAITGAPQFDFYLNPVMPRKEFFAKYGLDAKKRLVCFCAGLKSFDTSDGDDIDIIVKAMQDGRIPEDVQLIVRTHPNMTNFSSWKKFENSPRVALMKPGEYNEQSASLTGGFDATLDDMKLMAALMKYSDVFVNVHSTTSLDASIFDKPVVNIKFDGYEQNVPYADSQKSFFDMEYYKHLLTENAIWVTESPEELVESIVTYLKNPKLHAEGRKKLVAKMCYKLDGKSTQRIAKAVLSV